MPFVSTEQYAETLLVTLIDYFLSFFGLILSFLAVFTIIKSPHFVNSYGTLALNHTCCNILCLLVYFLWVTPTTYTQALDVSSSKLGKITGQLHLLFCICMVYSHLALSLNRFVTLLRSKTRSIFSHNISHFIIIFIWILAFLHTIPLFWYQDCYLTYDPSKWQWVMGGAKLCATFKLFVLQYLCTFLAGISFLLCLSTWTLMSGNTVKRHPMETKLLREELWRSCGFFVATLSSNILSGWVAERWQKYVLVCVSWQGYHLLDSLVVLLLHFHRKLLAERHPPNPDHHHTPSFIHVEHPGAHPSPNLHHHARFSKVDTV